MTTRAGRRFTLVTLAFIGCGSFGEGSDGPPPSTTDGGDASADAIALPDAAVAEGGCSTVFEERFDQIWMAPWKQDTATGGSLRWDADGGLQGGGLVATVDVPDGGTSAQIEREVQGAIPKAVSLSFAMRVPESNAGYFELGCTLQFHGTNQRTYLMFLPELYQDELSIDDNARLDGGGVDTKSGVKLGSPVRNKWYAIRLEMRDIGPTTTHAVAFVDGTERFSSTLDFPEPPAKLRIKCGVDHADEGAKGTVHVDDVVLETCP